MKTRGPALSNKTARTFDDLPKSHNHAQGIVHDGIARGHTALFDTGPQKSMIGRYGW